MVAAEELDLEASGFRSRPSEADLIVGEEAEQGTGEAEAVGDQAEGGDQLQSIKDSNQDQGFGKV